MLRDKITEAMKEALRTKDERTLATTRLMISRMRDLDIEVRAKGKKDGIGDEEMMIMLQGMIKQRRESIALYEKGKREDLVKQEAEEIAVIEKFLPKQLSDDDVKAAIEKIITELGATTIRDIGKVMAQLRKNYMGQLDFSKAGTVVRSLLD